MVPNNEALHQVKVRCIEPASRLRLWPASRRGCGNVSPRHHGHGGITPARTIKSSAHEGAFIPSASPRLCDVGAHRPRPPPIYVVAGVSTRLWPASRRATSPRHHGHGGDAGPNHKELCLTKAPSYRTGHSPRLCDVGAQLDHRSTLWPASRRPRLADPPRRATTGTARTPARTVQIAGAASDAAGRHFQARRFHANYRQ